MTELGPGILDAWTTDSRTVSLVRRDEDGKRKVSQVPYLWYFLLNRSDYKKISMDQWREWRMEGFVTKTEMDPVGKYVRVYSDRHTYPERSVKQQLLEKIIASGARPLEGDLTLADRFCIDTLIPIAGGYRVIYFDIETDDSEGTIEIGKHRILCCGFINREGKELWVVEDDEEKLLVKVSRILSSFDIAVGWNSSKFDWPYLRARFEKYGLRDTLWKVADIDLLHRFVVSLYFSKLRIRGWSLKNVAEQMLGKTKEDYVGQMTELFNHDREKLKEYNLNDVRLVKELDKKTGMVDSLIQQAILSGTTMRAISRQYRGTGKIIDMATLRESERQRRKGTCDHRFPTIFWQPRSSEFGITGGLVLEPKVGYHKMVYVYDFKSLYPSTIMTWNISPETFREEKEKNCYRSVNDFYYKKKPMGIIPSVIERFNEYREGLRAAQSMIDIDTPEYQVHDVGQAVAKAMSNAVYGVMAQQGSRYFNPKIAESVTLVGHFFLNTAVECLQDRGVNIIFGDTDSLGLTYYGHEWDLEKMMDWYISILKKKIKKKFGVQNPIIDLKLETVYDKLVICGKKNYFGHVIQSGEHPADFIDVKGLESVKRNTVPYTVRLLEELYVMLIAPGGDEDPELFKQWLIENKSKFIKEPLKGEDLAISQMVSKYPAEYKSDLVYARIASRMIEDGKPFYPGMNIRYVITEGPPKHKKLEGVLLEEYKGLAALDYYWDRKIMKPVMRILNVVFPDVEWGQFRIHWRRKKK